LNDIFDNVQDIVRSEARFASAQLREELENSLKTLRWNAVAALTGFLGLAFLLMCGFFALRYAVPAWAAAAIISVSLGAVCGLILTTVLAALQQALDQIWQSARLARTGLVGWVRTRFLSLGFILALGFLLLISLTISTGLAGMRSKMAHAYPSMVVAVAGLDFCVSLVLVAALFAMVYRYMPARKLPWRIVFVGGAITATLFDVGRWGVSLYLAHSTQATAFGAASSFAALLLWFYYTALIFLFGAELTACLGRVREEGDSGESCKWKGQSKSTRPNVISPKGARPERRRIA
jgi:YihY family inner membrane protein